MAVLALLDRMLNPNIGMVHRVAIMVEWVFQCVDAPTQHDMVVLSSSHQRHDGQDRFDASRIEPLNLSLIHRSEIPLKSRSLKDGEFSRNDLRLRTPGMP